MLTQMLPWIAVSGLLGLIAGLILGIYLASALVRGHYSHILTNTDHGQHIPKAAFIPRPYPASRPLDISDEEYYMRTHR
ncbi:hypothetical protein [Dictyobacter formicarum]|uniref:Uncharacterized protein n=1 Tax=Dictyobacter formicarum TaxID=2778368 RepID=A0ABQ3VAE7_9CHLR|nr:hypothetical protein [Dictyobacter formicarum]GHO82979.1 hypothetical protein KSZ_09850 [Dictyobacter formicarum]